MRTRGFTLLEVLVATVIFGLIATATYALLGSGQGVASRAEARARVLQTARAALRTLEDDIRGAVMSGSALDTGFIGTNGGSSDLPADTLELVAVNTWPNRTPDIGALPERKSDLSRVLYSIRDGKSNATAEKRGLVRERLPLLAPTMVTTGQDENVEEIAADVVGLDIRYFRDNWEETWDTTAGNPRLPKAVEITLYVRSEWRGEEQVEPFVTKFYLPLGAEAPAKQQGTTP